VSWTLIVPDNTEQRLTLPQADQARTDSAIIEDELEAIHARPAPSSMHRYSNRGRFDFTVAECDMVDGNSGIPSFEGAWAQSAAGCGCGGFFVRPFRLTRG